MAGYFSILARMAGSANPIIGPLLQAQGEPDSQAMQARLLMLEDPLSALHPDVKETSRLVYTALKAKNDTYLQFNDEFYIRYDRVLSMLVAHRYITTTASIGHRYYGGIRCSPAYTIYMCGLFEDTSKMDRLAEVMDNCRMGHSLYAQVTARDLGLPLPVVTAAFDGYESNGWGVCSKTLGEVTYRSLV